MELQQQSGQTLEPWQLRGRRLSDNPEFAAQVARGQSIRQQTQTGGIQQQAGQNVGQQPQHMLYGSPQGNFLRRRSDLINR